jgi:hypothetical protein
MAPSWIDSDERRQRRATRARFAHGVKIATTAGYASFGAAFFEPVVQGVPLEFGDYLWAAFGVVVLALAVWYAPYAGDDDVAS